MDKRSNTFEDTTLTRKDLQEIIGWGERQAYDRFHIPGFAAMRPGGKGLVRARSSRSLDFAHVSFRQEVTEKLL